MLENLSCRKSAWDEYSAANFLQQAWALTIPKTLAEGEEVHSEETTLKVAKASGNDGVGGRTMPVAAAAVPPPPPLLLFVLQLLLPLPLVAPPIPPPQHLIAGCPVWALEPTSRQCR